MQGMSSRMQYVVRANSIKVFNPLPVQFKSLLPGQEGCVFFSRHLNICTCQYALVHLGRQAAFKSSMLECVRAGKGLNLTAECVEEGV
jgi:hypothetical protein